MWFCRSRNLSEQDLDDEIQADLALEIQERIKSGDTPEEAARGARRAFGNIALAKDRTRDVWRRVWLESLVQDVKVASRFLLKRKTATLTIVLTLGVAVGASTIAIGALDHNLWRAIQAPAGGSLLTIYDTRAAAPQFQALSNSDYTTLRDRLRDRVDLAAFNGQLFTLEGIVQPTRIWGEVVSDNYFRVLGATALAGRLIGDLGARDAPVAVLSYDTWRSRFGGDPQIIGKALQLGRVRLTIIGIAAQGFHDPRYQPEFWAPLAMTNALLGADVMGGAQYHFLLTIGRPRAGVTRLQVQSFVQDFTTDTSRDGWRLAALPATYVRFWAPYRGAIEQSLGIFAALAIGILIIACANVAGLLIARSGERTHELAIRQALGGTRVQLFRRLVAECLLVTAAGWIVGLLLAWWSAPVFRSIPLPQWQLVTLTFDWRLVGIAGAIALVASLLFTTVTVWKGPGSDVHHALVASTRGVTGRAIAQRALVVTQLAIACITAMAATLLLRSLLDVDRVVLGFDTADRVAAQTILSDRGYTVGQAQMFYRRLEDALQQNTQVTGVALEFRPVLERGFSKGGFALPGASEPIPSRYNVVSTGYFQTMEIPLAAGRVFTDHDTEASEPVIVVNETIARRLEGNPVGQSIRMIGSEWGHDSGRALRVIGVAKDVQYNGITEPPQPYVYFPAVQSPEFTDFDVYVRSRLPAARSIALIRAEVHRLDPELALYDVGTLTDRVSAAEIVPRSSAVASTVLAGIAVFLALVGVYGTMTTSIENRRRELAIRSALGATTSQLVRRVVGEGAILTLIACVIGIGASLPASRALAGLLFGVRPQDLLSVSAAAALVIVASAVAWIAPSRRAAHVDPIAVLRAE